MAVHSQRLPASSASPGGMQLVRLSLAAGAALLVVTADSVWKAVSVAGGAVAMDDPTSLVKPVACVAVGLTALAAILYVPRRFLPGLMLLTGGIASNLLSLAVWHAVPNPAGLPVAGGMVWFNLADACVCAGALLLGAAAVHAIATLPGVPRAEPAQALVSPQIRL